MNETLLALLIGVRQNGRPLETIPPASQPASLDEAYATADALARWIGQAVVGWKIGASVARAQQALGLAEPFAGRIFAGDVVANGGMVRPLLPTLTIGAEFTCRLGRDLGPAERFEATTIAGVITAVYPSLELNQVSFAHPLEAGGLCIIADNGFNAGLLLGQPLPAWEIESLMNQAVAFYRDEQLQGSGYAADIAFNPLEALAWLANDRAQRGDPLRAGQLVATGDLVGAIEAQRGSMVMADFGAWGQVQMEIG